jgi:hypothetical protein
MLQRRRRSIAFGSRCVSELADQKESLTYDPEFALGVDIAIQPAAISRKPMGRAADSMLA